jgi:hypothetical protein
MTYVPPKFFAQQGGKIKPHAIKSLTFSLKFNAPQQNDVAKEQTKTNETGGALRQGQQQVMS